MVTFEQLNKALVEVTTTVGIRRGTKTDDESYVREFNRYISELGFDPDAVGTVGQHLSQMSAAMQTPPMEAIASAWVMGIVIGAKLGSSVPHA